MSNPAINIGVTATDSARAVLDGVDNKVRQTASNVEQASGKIESKTARMAEQFRKNFASIATTAAGLTSGIAGFATSFDVLQKAQTKADQAQLTYEKSLRRLEEMQADGSVSTRELAEQHEKVRLNAEKAAQAQDNLGDTYVNFFANIPAQMVSFGVSANGIFNMLKTTQASTAATTVATSATYSGALASMNVATGAATAGMHTFRLASIAAFITNPAGLAIIGITTGVTLLATSMGWLNQKVDTSTETLQEHSKTIEATKDKTQTYDEYVKSLAERMQQAHQDNLNYIQSTGKVADVQALTNIEVQQAAEYLRSLADKTAETAQKNFELVASTYGLETALAISGEQVDHVASALKKFETIQERASVAQKDAKEIADDEARAQRRATDEIRERVKANVDFLKSMGISIDMNENTAKETERLAEHVRDLQGDYEDNRFELEKLANALGIDLVQATNASDTELVQMVKSVQNLSDEIFVHRGQVVDDFEQSRRAVDQYSGALDSTKSVAEIMSSKVVTEIDKVTQSMNSLDHAAKVARERADSIVADALRAQAALNGLGSAGGGGSFGGFTGTPSPGPGVGAIGRIGRDANLFAAHGMNETVFRRTHLIVGENGPEHVNVTPAGRGSGSGGGPVEINLILNSKKIASATIDDIEYMIRKRGTRELRLHGDGIFGVG